MKIKIVGIQPQDYKLDNGYAFKGVKVHAIDLETLPNGQVGNQVINSIKIPEGSPLSQVPLEIGKTYTVYFTQKGQLDTILPVE